MQYLNVDRSTKTPFQYLKKQILYEYFFENQKMWIFFSYLKTSIISDFRKKILKKSFLRYRNDVFVDRFASKYCIYFNY